MAVLDATPGRPGLAARWPTALAIVGGAVAILVIVLLDAEAELFGPVVVMMAGIYLLPYGAGRPWMAWPALGAFSALVSVLHVLDGRAVLPVEPGIAMSVVVVLVWLWTVVRRRYTDGGMFRLQTAGTLVFGAVTVVCVAVEPRWGTLLAGAGFLAHGAWDVYHHRADRVVHRSYAEFCGVVDVVVGPALIVAALAG
jgi:hypothetical protein